MKPLHRKKAITLYETRMRAGYVVKTVVFYMLATILWYMLAVLLPYTATVTVSAADNARLTREAFSASEAEINRDDSEKERALLMPTSESSFQRRLKLIEDAKSTIDCMIFTAYEQSFSYLYYTALFRAADRGAKVRIIVDGKMGSLSGKLDAMGKILSNHNNIELYYFNKVNIFDPAGLMVLMHDKVTIVDGHILIVGGVNMGTAAYLSNYDMEVMITNSGENGSVGQAAEYFRNMLKSGLVKRIKSKKSDISAKNKYEAEFNKYYAKSEFADKTIDYGTQGVAINKATFLSNPISTTKKSPILLQAVFNLMESSKNSIAVTPYIMLENDKKARLKRIAAKNDEVLIITNSLYNSRNVGYADYYNTREDYLSKNIAIWEYQAKNQLHAKLYSFDGRYSVIGSFNLDERSAHIDTESMIVIDSEDLTAQLNDYIRTQFIDNSLKVGSNNEYLPSDTVKKGDVPAKKKFLYTIYGALGVIRCLL
ncbi:MAG: phosphatidylserine/phosphatidylglycerophosphate/cardiolipin synthase family protein [Clostridiales bacterium]|nr:phosphatidylserine/phosphatidylglycerophosphate/cardiolipin synthase family protein [Clostridiales bacterium]